MGNEPSRPGKDAKLPKPKRKAGGRPFQKGHTLGKRFEKGCKPGPGRPKLPPGYNEAFDLMEPKAWEALDAIVEDPAHRDRLQAAKYIVDRRRGKPTERTEVTGAGGKDLIPTRDEAIEALRQLVKKPET